jgi:hypothetical protein
MVDNELVRVQLQAKKGGNVKAKARVSEETKATG